MKAACCCETVHVDAAPAPARQHAANVAPASAATTVVIAIAVVAPPTRRAEIVRTHEAVGPPEPLFVVHCALLL